MPGICQGYFLRGVHYLRAVSERFVQWLHRLLRRLIPTDWLVRNVRRSPGDTAWRRSTESCRSTRRQHASGILPQFWLARHSQGLKLLRPRLQACTTNNSLTFRSQILSRTAGAGVDRFRERCFDARLHLVGQLAQEWMEIGVQNGPTSGADRR